MTITLLQTDIQWAQPDENMKRAECLIERHEGADLYVLPEMWATGFATTPMEVPINDEPLIWMQRMAGKYRCALSGSLAVLTGGEYRNRHYFVTPGDVTYYDKHHLFTYGHEDTYFKSGQVHVVVDYQGVRILLLTCYDLRFPVWARYGLAGSYDMIVAVANWPESRQQAWRVLTRARAIENQCYLVGVNRVGDDSFCHYVGESLVCGPQGETLKQCGNEEETMTVELDFASLEYIRGRFRVLDDRD
jgi:predicted amidohydrolase